MSSPTRLYCDECYEPPKAGDSFWVLEGGTLCDGCRAERVAGDPLDRYDHGTDYVIVSDTELSDPRLPGSRFTFNVTIGGI